MDGGYVEPVLRRVGKLANGWVSYFYTPDSFEKSWHTVLDSVKSSGMALDTFGNCDMVPVRIDRSEVEARRVANDFIAKYCDLPAWSESTQNSAIIGTVKDCTNMIERYMKAGVHELVVIPSVAQLNEIDEQINRFGKELLPSFS
jgi:alkanesulfonate monooxygenase